MNEEFLRKIGFTGFIFGEKSKRDGFRRLTWSNKVGNGNLMTIRLVFIDEIWQIEFCKIFDDREEKHLKGLSMDDIVKVVKKYGINTFEPL